MSVYDSTDPQFSIPETVADTWQTDGLAVDSRLLRSY